MTNAFRAFVAICAIALLAACAPTAESPAEASPRLVPPEGVTEWSHAVHGVNVMYGMVGEDSPEGQLILNARGAGATISTMNGECRFSFLPKYFDAPDPGLERATYERQVSFLANGIGMCLYELVVAPGEEYTELDFAYSEAWRNLYLERCGYVVHPLGWQNQDSNCQPPAPAEVNL